MRRIQRVVKVRDRQTSDSQGLCPRAAPLPSLQVTQLRAAVKDQAWSETSPTGHTLTLPCWPTPPAPRPGSGSREQKPQGEVRLETSSPLGAIEAAEPGRAAWQVPAPAPTLAEHPPSAWPATQSQPCPQGAHGQAGQAANQQMAPTRSQASGTTEMPAPAWRCAPERLQRLLSPPLCPC